HRSPHSGNLQGSRVNTPFQLPTFLLHILPGNPLQTETMFDEIAPQPTRTPTVQFILRDLDTGRFYKRARLWVNLTEEPAAFTSLEEAIALARQLPLPNLEILLLAHDQPVMRHRVAKPPPTATSRFRPTRISPERGTRMTKRNHASPS